MIGDLEACSDLFGLVYKGGLFPGQAFEEALDLRGDGAFEPFGAGA